jgi:gliding motility associated protien GldN
MRRFLYTGFLFLAFGLAAGAQQDPNQRTPRISRGEDRRTPRRGSEQVENRSGLPEPTVRAQILNEQLTREIGNARWMRVIYRELDLTLEKNAPLYYPVQETNGMKNLFTTLFQLVSEDKVRVYKYLPDGSESFEENNLLSFKDMLDNFGIFYEEVPAGGGQPARFVINESDIPSREVRSLLIKEAWYFDQNSSIYDVKTLAICPIAFTFSDVGEQRQPMFWVEYEAIRPYVKNNYIMTSNINNAKTYTIDDFFRRRMFDGEIVKTENFLNLALREYCPTPDSMLAEQQRIEHQLKSFNDSLWIPADTTVVLSRKDAKKTLRSSTARGSGKGEGASPDKNKTSSAKKESAPKQPKPSTEKATQSTPTRSIRRR